MRRDTRRTGVFTRRALLMIGGQVALLGGLGVRLYQVQVADAARYRTLSDENRISARMIVLRVAASWTASASSSPATRRTGAPFW